MIDCSSFSYRFKYLFSALVRVTARHRYDFFLAWRLGPWSTRNLQTLTRDGRLLATLRDSRAGASVAASAEGRLGLAVSPNSRSLAAGWSSGGWAGRRDGRASPTMLVEAAV